MSLYLELSVLVCVLFLDLTSQAADLSDRFLLLKKEINEQLTSACLGAQQLTHYCDQLTANREELDSIKERTQVALRMPPSISGSQVDDINMKVCLRHNWMSVQRHNLASATLYCATLGDRERAAFLQNSI